MAYREYFFEREPFLPALDVEMRGRDKEWGQIEAFLEESFQGNRTRAFLILADYGYGKTFILNKIREGVSDPESKIKGANKTIRWEISQLILEL
jgi:Cdc6-like AAA superfamily ATPase